MFESNVKVTNEKIWIKFVRRHWKMLVVFVIAAVLAAAGAILVFLWLAGNAQSNGLVPADLDGWSVGHIVTFLLHLIFWEVLLIGVPVIVAVAAFYMLWWKKLPRPEREEYKRKKLFGSKSSKGGGGCSIFIEIIFIIKIYIDGNWNVPISTWSFDYLVHTCLWALMVGIIIVGIPVAIGGTWWLRHEMKKKPTRS